MAEETKTQSGAIKITPAEALAMIDQEDVAVLDVRYQNEYKEGHIKEAILLPIDELNVDTTARALPNQSQKILVYCRSGVRSAAAAKILIGLGYSNIFDLGGIESWPYETTKE